MGFEEGFQPGVERLVAHAGAVKKGLSPCTPGVLQGFSKQDLFAVIVRFHKRARLVIYSYVRIPAEKGMGEFHRDWRISTASQARA